MLLAAFFDFKVFTLLINVQLSYFTCKACLLYTHPTFKWWKPSRIAPNSKIRLTRPYYTKRDSKYAYEMVCNFNRIFMNEISKCIKDKARFAESEAITAWFDSEIMENVERAVQINSRLGKLQKTKELHHKLVTKRKEC